jgi:hypothetical protein
MSQAPLRPAVRSFAGKMQKAAVKGEKNRRWIEL